MMEAKLRGKKAGEGDVEEGIKEIRDGLRLVKAAKKKQVSVGELLRVAIDKLPAKSGLSALAGNMTGIFAKSKSGEGAAGGDAADAAYIVLEGECQAERGEGVLRHELRRMGPGEMFGETAVLTRNPRSATVTAVTRVTVAVVDSLYLQEEMEKSSFMARAIRTVAERFLDLNEETATFRIQKRQAQVVNLVLRHLALDGVHRDGATRTAWKPLLASLVKQTQLPEAEVEAELLRQKGLAITGDELVLSR
jgi:CRP-like cAMP-binding protein